MTVDSEQDLIALKKIGKIVATVREEMLKLVRPGITTAELDHIGGKILNQHGAASAPRKEYNFPGNTCISLNRVVAHGIPDSTVLREGDLVNIDVSAELGGYYADTGATAIVQPSVAPLKERLCDCSLRALHKAIAKAKAGGKLNQLGRAVYNEARTDGFTIVRNLTGHGIGRKLHEEPEHVMNYYDARDQRLLGNGLVLAVETFVSTGAEYIEQGSDGWALMVPDNSLVAQYEHTIVVTRGKPIILTA